MSQSSANLLPLLCLALLSLAPVTLRAEDVAAPEADETLIYLIREGRFLGSGGALWVALNDQTVARLKNKRHAIIRTTSGVNTLNLATGGMVVAAAAVDNRPGATVYLKYRFLDTEITEIDSEEAAQLLKKSKPMEPLEAPLPNNEKIAVLINLSRLGLDITRASTQRLAPDDNHAVITIFRRQESKKLDFGIWSEHDFLGTLKVNQGLEVRVPAGKHFFLAGNVGTSLLQAQVEAGKRYYAWLDVGAVILRVRLTPVTQQASERLNEWLTKVEWVERDPVASIAHLGLRKALVTGFVRSAAARANAGEAGFQLLGAEHAY